MKRRWHVRHVPSWIRRLLQMQSHSKVVCMGKARSCFISWNSSYFGVWIKKCRKWNPSNVTNSWWRLSFLRKKKLSPAPEPEKHKEIKELILSKSHGYRMMSHVRCGFFARFDRYHWVSHDVMNPRDVSRVPPRPGDVLCRIRTQLPWQPGDPRPAPQQLLSQPLP